MTEPLSITGLSAHYGSTQVLTDLSLSVGAGELVSLLGASGCGKTTTLRVVAGFLPPTTGQVSLGGRDLARLPAHKRNIGLVFQTYALFPHLTVRDNVAFGLKQRGMGGAERFRKADAMLERVGLEALAERLPAALSGGQRQRVALARALVIEPPLLMFDEPLSNLDAKLRVQMRAEIAALQRELAVTTVYVTHDQIEAMTMGDRVAVLKDGYLQQVDSPQNLYDRPDNVFVAAFIGSPSMNLYEASLRIEGDNATVGIGSQAVTLDPSVLGERPALRAYADKPVILGIRPEDFEDAEMMADIPVDRRITAKVSLIEALGSELMVHFGVDAAKIDSGDPDAIEEASHDGTSTAVGRFSPRSRVRMGDTIEIAVSTERFHFFDPDTRLAIWH